MIIIPFNGENKTISFIGRGVDHYLFRFKNEFTNEEIFLNVSGLLSVGINKNSVTDTFSSLKNNNTYSLTVYSSLVAPLLTADNPTSPLSFDKDAVGFITYRDIVAVGINTEEGSNYTDIVEHKTENKYTIL